MPPIDPNAPWWANILMLITILAVVPAATAWLAGRRDRRTLRQVADVTTRTLGQVENEHLGTDHPNLREDLDAKIDRVCVALDRMANAQDATRADVGGLHAEVRDVRRDITGIRTDARRDRRDVTDLRESIPDMIAAAITDTGDQH